MDMSLSKFRDMAKDGEPGALQSMGSQTVNLVTEQLTTYKNKKDYK